MKQHDVLKDYDSKLFLHKNLTDVDGNIFPMDSLDFKKVLDENKVIMHLMGRNCGWFGENLTLKVEEKLRFDGNLPWQMSIVCKSF